MLISEQPAKISRRQNNPIYWRGPNYRKEFAVYWLFCNQNQEKHRKKYQKIQGQLKLYQTVYFLSRNSKYKLRKSGVLWPLLLLYFPLTSHSIIGNSVSMSVKHKPLHWYCTLLSENPSLSYNSPLVNQKPVCYFKSKYPVNMTDEEWLQVFEKKVSGFEVLHFPRTRIWSGEREDAHLLLWNFYYWSKFDNFSCVALIFHSADDTVFQFRKSAFEVREMTRHPIIEFFR